MPDHPNPTPPADVQERIRQFWNEDAETYDRSPSHSISHPAEASAWRAALARHLPPSPSRVLDAGAGTGAISLLVAELGHEVTALDLSPEMLSRAAQKASRRGLDIEVVVGSVLQPPPGPFDAIVERHVLWTTPEPVRVLQAWRSSLRPDGRLVLYEGMYQRRGLTGRLRSALAGAVRSLMGVHEDHHAEYDPEVIASLPLAGAMSPGAVIEALAAAGWRRVRLERLWDVEWARRLSGPPPLGWLEQSPQFAVLAEP